MKYFLTFLTFFFVLGIYAQNYKIQFIKKKSLNADKFYGVDIFDNTYYSRQNVLIKANSKKIYQYHNLALGNIYSVSVYNPLKIVVFYKDFYTVIILDNTLNEIQKLEFLNKNITLVAKAGENELWLYNADEQQLELYNYQTKTILGKTQPYSILNPKKLKGNTNFAWIQINSNNLDVYNNYGSMVNSYHLKFDNFNIITNKIVLFNNANSFYLSDNKSLSPLLKVPFKIQSSSITNNKIYLFNNKQIFIYKLLKN